MANTKGYTAPAGSAEDYMYLYEQWKNHAEELARGMAIMDKILTIHRNMKRCNAEGDADGYLMNLKDLVAYLDYVDKATGESRGYHGS